MPIGSKMRSYSYSSTGKMIHKGKFSRSKNNEAYSKYIRIKSNSFIYLCLDTGDVIGVYLHLLACKPEFMRPDYIPRLRSSLVESENVTKFGDIGRSHRIDSC